MVANINMDENSGMPMVGYLIFIWSIYDMVTKRGTGMVPRKDKTYRFGLMSDYDILKVNC